MIERIGIFFAEKVSRWLPESLVFAFILTFIAAILALGLTPTQPMELVQYWYGGFWQMLEFAMQMALIITLGYTIGISGPVTRFFDSLARKVQRPRSAYLIISLVSLGLVLVNWGLAPVAAVFAAEVCRRVEGIDFRLACVAVYTALIPWHGGLSASAPLMMNTPGNQFIEMGLVEDVIPTSATLGSMLNITLIITSVIIIPLIILLLAPRKVEERFDAAKQQPAADETSASTQTEPETQPETKKLFTPSDRMNNTWIMNLIIVAAGFLFIIPFFAQRGIDGLELNSVNFTLLMLGLALHGTPMRYLQAVRESVKGLGDLIIQFPFYAGIMGIFMLSGLAEIVAQWFVNISTELTYPLFVFIAAAITNLFIPSGGGQWVVLGPAVIPPTEALGVPVEKIIITFGYGDALTNLINPFWTLVIIPVMAKVMNIRARDFMGYAVLMAIIFFFIISGVILLVP